MLFRSRREQNGRLFTAPGWVVFAAVVVGALAGLIGLATGFISI